MTPPTPDRLAEIYESLPEEARPKSTLPLWLTRHHHDPSKIERHTGYHPLNYEELDADLWHITAALEKSCADWLSKQCEYVAIESMESDGKEGYRVTARNYGPKWHGLKMLMDKVFTGPTRLEALASACQAVKEGK